MHLFLAVGCVVAGIGLVDQARFWLPDSLCGWCIARCLGGLSGARTLLLGSCCGLLLAGFRSFALICLLCSVLLLGMRMLRTPGQRVPGFRRIRQ